MAENKKSLYKMARKVLPKDYELSLVFANDKLARSLNKKYRQRDYTPNVLVFPYSKRSGEIFLNLSQIKKDAKNFGMTQNECLKFMLIHGCLHLKGLKHGAKMERQEKRWLEKISQ